MALNFVRLTKEDSDSEELEVEPMPNAFIPVATLATSRMNQYYLNI